MREDDEATYTNPFLRLCLTRLLSDTDKYHVCDYCHHCIMFWASEMVSEYRLWYLVDPYGSYILATNVTFLVYPMTMLTTTYLAVARCACVTRPIQFGNTFTLSRSSAILTVFAFVTLASYIPVLANMDIGQTFDPRVNSSRIVLWSSPDRQLIKDIIWAARDTFLSIVSQIVVTLCVFVMSYQLKKSWNFRKSCSSENYINESLSKKGEANRLNTKLPVKELKLLKQVTALCSAYVVCNFPKVLVNVAGISEPDFNFTKRFQNVQQTTIIMMNIFQMLNCALNLLINLKFNSKFRQYCKLC
ncbi:hypothetical protein Btru_002114 [Bulinus truncatus]|nr:hypothetical protein Btru_002114 [Bulinus truncatus]